MSPRLTKVSLPRRGGGSVPPAPRPVAPNTPEAAPKPEESAELVVQRDRLLEKFTVMQADLGGAFYEMAIRDHVRMDVLTRKAAELQRVDAELLAVERVLELQRNDAAGLCPSCGAPFAPGVRFCAQCGNPLFPTPAPPPTPPIPETNPLPQVGAVVPPAPGVEAANPLRPGGPTPPQHLQPPPAPQQQPQPPLAPPNGSAAPPAPGPPPPEVPR
jgi:hypothetical protein